MVIKNKSTLKEYPVSKAKWASYPARVKDLFTVVDDSEIKDAQSQPIKNVVEKQDAKAKKSNAPATGNKGEVNSKHKK